MRSSRIQLLLPAACLPVFDNDDASWSGDDGFEAVVTDLKTASCHGFRSGAMPSESHPISIVTRAGNHRQCGDDIRRLYIVEGGGLMLEMSE